MGRNDQYKEIFRKIKKDEKLEEQEIRDILRYYEYVGEFLKDGVLSYDHVLHIHGMNLKKMYEKEDIRKVFDVARKNRPNYSYVNLHDMFLRINEDLEFESYISNRTAQSSSILFGIPFKPRLNYFLHQMSLDNLLLVY